MSPLDGICAGVFWLSTALVFYTYVGYPLVIWTLSRWAGARVAPLCPEENVLPAVSLLIAAYNEEAVIERRIQTALAMDYPRDRLEIVIASDGSTDRTAEIVRRYTAQGVRLVEFTQRRRNRGGFDEPDRRAAPLMGTPERRGKAAVLNAAIPQLRGEIVLLSDANTQIDASALRHLIRWFSDPAVGVVSGRLLLTDPQTGRNVDSLYWKYETFLKKCESPLGALLGANGAIYAIRKEVYTPIPNNTLVDDFVIPLFARLRTGCELVYDRDALAREETAPDIEAEFHRRCRLGAGGFQSIGMLWRLLDPRRGWIAFTFCSHKIGRWLCPFFLLAMLAASVLLHDLIFYRTALAAQLGFYVVAGLAAYLPARWRPFRYLRVTTMFASMNLALLVGFVRWLRGSQKAAWRRTPRTAEATGVAS